MHGLSTATGVSPRRNDEEIPPVARFDAGGSVCCGSSYTAVIMSTFLLGTGMAWAGTRICGQWPLLLSFAFLMPSGLHEQHCKVRIPCRRPVLSTRIHFVIPTGKWEGNGAIRLRLDRGKIF